MGYIHVTIQLLVGPEHTQLLLPSALDCLLVVGLALVDIGLGRLELKAELEQPDDAVVRQWRVPPSQPPGVVLPLVGEPPHELPVVNAVLPRVLPRRVDVNGDFREGAVLPLVLHKLRIFNVPRIEEEADLLELDEPLVGKAEILGPGGHGRLWGGVLFPSCRYPSPDPCRVQRALSLDPPDEVAMLVFVVLAHIAVSVFLFVLEEHVEVVLPLGHPGTEMKPHLLQHGLPILA
mmetsp:Transcript_3788/g.10206  ORF Transcript_3788/g.10206 Transcript_3788/m.10206 type:complete len:234 (-) Transcript_3788:781-1482(-)